jgi:hypothetical protein
MNPVYYAVLFYTYKTHFNIILSYELRLPSVLFRSGFQAELLDAFLLSPTHTACPTFLILILSPNNIWPEVQITKQQKKWWGQFWWQCKQACINLFCAPRPPQKNEYCGSRLERQACRKHSDLPSCMITSPSSIATPWLLPKRFSYTLRGTNKQCKSISSRNPPLYDRWRSSVSCVWSYGGLAGCDPFILCTLVLFMWWIVMVWKERQFQLLLTTKHTIGACFNKRRDKSGNDASGPGILKPIFVGALGVSCTPKITERTWFKFGTDSVRVASSRYYAIWGRGQKSENQITQTLISAVAGSKEWFVFYCWKT